MIANLPNTTFFNYLQSRLKCKAMNGGGAYELFCMALAIDGRPKPFHVTHKVWAMENSEFVRALDVVASAPAKKVKKSVVRALAKQVKHADRGAGRQKTAKPPGKIAFHPWQVAEIKQASMPPWKEDVMGKAFLQTFAWRQLRMRALVLHGARCQCCGDTPANGAIMNVDHIKPRRLFPELALKLDNLQILCSACNHGKANDFDTDWRTASPELTDYEREGLRILRSL